ncbi:MAG: class II aldolase/adducin family protein [Eubacterium sp.]|jgi:L-fuculose-phosphate aldolase|nr:class II aldolase/adducin family protein [Eubacterium sp.]MCI2198100.1 class II aldolase/adducin family protein [Eubacterium sp.]
MMILRAEEECREMLVVYGQRLLASGLVQGTWGNLSVRLNDEKMLVTPSGLDYERLQPEDMVVVSIKNLKYDRFGNKPTSERGLHAGIYRRRPDAGAVIHTHSTYCSVFAAAKMPLEVENPALAEEVGSIIRVADYARPGTNALSRNTIRALGSGKGCIMAHHGMICCGVDLKQAFHTCSAIEEAARQYIESRIND